MNLQCPKCGRAVAAAHGAAQAQCFGCGTIVPLGRPAAQPQGSPPANSNAMKFAFIGLGVLSFLVFAAVVAGVVLLGGNGETASDDAKSDVAANQNSLANGDQTTEPVITASDEERRLAATVPENIRKQIVQMWDDMRGSTGKPVMAPKGFLRDRTEDMLSGIEQREITRMAALFSLEEKQVQAVIQVHRADSGEPAS